MILLSLGVLDGLLKHGGHLRARPLFESDKGKVVVEAQYLFAYFLYLLLELVFLRVAELAEVILICLQHISFAFSYSAHLADE